MVGYTIYLSRYDASKEPTAYFYIGPSENNGVDNESVPIPILEVFIKSGHKCFVVDGDLTSRFVPNFTFRATNEEETQAYTVIPGGSYLLPKDDKLITVIPTTERAGPTNYKNITYTVPEIFTSLQLTGNGVPTYNQTTTWGNALLNNLVRMLEHFANDVPPPSPLEGQLWFNTTLKQMLVFDGNGWKPIAVDVPNVSDLITKQDLNALQNNIISVKADNDHVLSILSVLDNKINNLGVPSQEFSAREPVIPYDISLFVFQITDNAPALASSILFTRSVFVSSNDKHAVKALIPPRSQASMELIKITNTHEHTVGIVIIGAGSLVGHVNLYEDFTLHYGDLLILRPLEIDLTVRNVFITIAGSVLQSP